MHRPLLLAALLAAPALAAADVPSQFNADPACDGHRAGDACPSPYAAPGLCGTCRSQNSFGTVPCVLTDGGTARVEHYPDGGSNEADFCLRCATGTTDDRACPPATSGSTQGSTSTGGSSGGSTGGSGTSGSGSTASGGTSGSTPPPSGGCAGAGAALGPWLIALVTPVLVRRRRR